MTEAGGLLGPDLARWLSLRARSPAEAARRLAGRAAVRDLVRELDLFPWRGFTPTDRGRKPAFEGASADFSISHTADRMLVAVAKGRRIGVDIEEASPVFDSLALQRRMCSPAELARTATIDPVSRRRWLTRLWTAKEALSKADGHGLRKDFRTIELLPLAEMEWPDLPFVAAIATRSHNSAGTVEIWHPDLSVALALSER